MDPSTGSGLHDDVVAVIGAGPVGLAVASRLAAHGRRVLLIEGGGERSGRDATASRATTSGQPLPHSLDQMRAGGLGGTSSMWIRPMFRCRPLDGMDFEPRPDGLHGGWPIGPADIDGHLGHANEIFGLSPATYDPSELSPGAHVVSSDVLRTGMFRLADLDRFDEFVRRTVSHPNVTLLTDTEVVRVLQTVDGTTTGVRLATRDGMERDVDCDAVVLAAGGLENARLLLLSQEGDGDGRTVGNAAGLVGRGFMEHPHIRLGHVRPRHDTSLRLFDRCDGPGGRTEGYLALTPAALLEHRLPQAAVWLHPVSLHDSVVDLGGDLLAAVRAPRGTTRTLLADVRRVASTASDRVRHPGARSFDRLVSCEIEQFPTFDSAVSLGDDVDAFGRRNLHLHWTLGAEFDRLHERLVAVLAPAFVDAGIGELVPFGPEDRRRSIDVGHHHMGTTRMGATPADGVVDGDCKVHGTDGLFVVGSSVFTTSGAANPTLTAVALALRLGDHLSGVAGDDGTSAGTEDTMCDRRDEGEPVSQRVVARNGRRVPEGR